MFHVSHSLNFWELEEVKGSYRPSAWEVKGHYFCFPLFPESGLFRELQLLSSNSL